MRERNGLAAEAFRFGDLGSFGEFPIGKPSGSGDQGESADREGGVKRAGLSGVRVPMGQRGWVSGCFRGE